MDEDRTGNRPTGWQRPEVQALASMFAAAVLMTAVALVALAVEGGRPPRLVLTGTTWQWSGSTGGSAGSADVVPDPAAYTLQFSRDGTYRATADCVESPGTYVVVPAGRTGGGTNGLTIVPDPAVGPVSCGSGSMSDVFLGQLVSAARYAISGSRLTVTLVPPGTMTFEAAAPIDPTPGS